MDTKTAIAATAALPADCASVALIDAKQAAAVGAMSVSWWFDEARAGRAPAPVIRGPRCTRWRSSDVSRFYSAFGADAAASSASAATTAANAARASAAARAKRVAESASAVVTSGRRAGAAASATLDA